MVNYVAVGFLVSNIKVRLLSLSMLLLRSFFYGMNISVFIVSEVINVDCSIIYIIVSIVVTTVTKSSIRHRVVFSVVISVIVTTSAIVNASVIVVTVSGTAVLDNETNTSKSEFSSSVPLKTATLCSS